MQHTKLFALYLLGSLFSSSCVDLRSGQLSPPDAMVDGYSVDSPDIPDATSVSIFDTSTVDTSTVDTSTVDTSTVDTPTVDTSTVDTSTVDTSTVDTDACMTPCLLAHADAECRGGVCVVTSCASGFADCDSASPNGCEVNTQNDNDHCGACGRTCPSGQRCSSGTCSTTCGSGLADCSGTCVNVLADNANCGACGRACPSGQSCNAGMCVCPSGQNYCPSPSACVNFQNDSNNCGACNRVCPSGQRCAGGTCSTSCPSGQTDCSGVCRDTQTDPVACGTCSTRCMRTNGVAGCNMGACTLLACNTGRGNCDGNDNNGCEIDTNTNASNCGVCGNSCQFANASASCAAGRCVMGTCNAGFADCNSNPIDGCETNTASGDTSNCGMCGRACGTPPVGTTYSCTSGVCRISAVSCPADRRNCDGNDSNGCETQQLTDVSNCGACGTVCSQTGGTRSCVGGTCRITCNAGLGNCDGTVTNGCETNTNTNANNCGACGRACSLANATPGCSSGNCTVATCNSGFANCDGTASNGCEINLRTDNNNCGACGAACTGGARCSNGTCVLTCPSGQTICSASCVTTSTDPDHCGGCGMACSGNHVAARTCAASACTSPCVSGFGDCDSNLRSNGCEMNINTSTNNCGGCGWACSSNHITPTCAGGNCNGSCAAGYGDCDGDKRSNGCETALTSTTNCGACGTVCPTRANATPQCSAGACSFTCNAGFADCDGNPANGCESNTNTNTTNCGACGIACPTLANATPRCSSGVCGFSCNVHYGDCDGNAANGCETMVDTVTNCGSCGNVCPTRNNATARCTLELCSFSCNLHFEDCNDNAADGCEANIWFDDNHCGGCGATCDLGQHCFRGLCT